MKKLVVFLVLGFAFISISSKAVADDAQCANLLNDAEALWAKHDLNGSDKACDEVISKCPKIAEPYWRKARNEYDRIEQIPRDKKPDEDTLIERYRGVEALAQKCIDIDGKDGSCYLWSGVGMGRRGTTQGILNSLTEADDLEAIFLKAADRKPAYRAADGTANSLGDTYTALCQFYRVVPEWLAVFPFKQIFGVAGDLGKAVEYGRKALEQEPKRIEYAKDLSAALICNGQKHEKPEQIEEAKKLLSELQSWPELKPTDPIDKKHAKDLIADPSLACGYSRDAQQVQDQDKLKQ
jgi:tetratricopeptide (TPR) repeat protein